MSKTIAAARQPKAAPRSGSLIKNLGITFFENVTTKGLNFLIILVLSRTLGPEAYGRYSFVFVAVTLCSALFDFGMENTAVRFAAKEKDHKESIFGLYLTAKLAILLGLVLLLVFGNHWIFSALQKPEISRFTGFMVVGLLGESLFFVNDTFLQADQQFVMRGILNIARYSVSFLGVLFLLTSKHLYLDWVMYIYWVPLLFSVAFLGKYATFLKAFWGKAMNPVLRTEIFRYEKWMFIYSIANNLLGRLDFFMLGFWVGFHQLGIYNAGLQLCGIVSFLPLVLGKVLLPALSEKTEAQIYETSGKMIRGTLLLSAIALVFVPLGNWAVPLLLGEQYRDSILVLQILMVAFIGSLLSMPYEQALYSLGKPDILCACRYFQLAMLIALNVLLIPVFGIYGAAGVTLLGRVVYLMQVRWFYRKFESLTVQKQKLELVMGAS